MIEIADFDGCFHQGIKYGGLSCRKEVLSFEGSLWMVKFQGRNSRIKRMRKDENLPSYTNSVITEWLGSHVYEALGFPVQETRLGILNGKLVVACRHIYEDGENLQELRGMLEALNDEMFEYFSSGGTISDILDITEILRTNGMFPKTGLAEHFWDLFVADAFIANTDRNLGNVGLVFSPKTESFRISPVYDNGSSFNCRITEELMKNMFSDWKRRYKSVLLNSACPYKINDEHIAPLTHIFRNPCDECIEAIGRVVPRIDLAKCIRPVLELKNAGLITRTQAAFYAASMSVRYRKRLRPAYEKHFGPLPEKRHIKEAHTRMR